MMGSSLPVEVRSARALLRWQFRMAHALLDATIDGLNVEAFNRRSPRSSASAGVCFAQVVLNEDLTINGVLASGTPLALSTWAGRTGLSELPTLAHPTDWRAWSHDVRINLAQVRPYARAVHAATDAYVAAVPEDGLGPAHDQVPADLLTALLLAVSMRRGEIACLLALQLGEQWWPNAR
jgi:hypothetical protein